MFSGWIYNGAGSRTLLQISSVLAIVGAVVVTVKTELVVLCLSQTLTGIAMGIISTIIPIYQSETVPSENLGSSLSVFQMAIGAGSLFCTVLIILMEQHFDTQWFNYSTTTRVIPTFILFILSFVLPESPSWLARNTQWKNVSKYLTVIKKFNCHTGSNPSSVEKVPKGPEFTFFQIFNSKLKKQLIIGLTFLVISEAICFRLLTNTFTFVCNGCGLSKLTCSILSTFQYIILILFTIFPLTALDYCRRIDSVVFGMVLLAISLMVIFLMIAIFGILQPIYFNPNLPINIRILGQPASIVLSLYLFIPAIYGSTISTPSLLYICELFPHNARSKGLSICIGIAWMMSTLTTFFYHVIIKAIGIWSLLCLSIICILGAVIVALFPESIDFLLTEEYQPNFLKKKDTVESKENPRDNGGVLSFTSLTNTLNSEEKAIRNSIELQDNTPGPKKKLSVGKRNMPSRIHSSKSSELALTTPLPKTSSSLDELQNYSDSSIMRSDKFDFRSARTEMLVHNSPKTIHATTIIDGYVDVSPIPVTAIQNNFDERVLDQAIAPHDEEMFSEKKSPEESSYSCEWLEGSNKDIRFNKNRLNTGTSLGQFSQLTSQMDDLQSLARNNRTVDRTKLRGGLFLNPTNQNLSE